MENMIRKAFTLATVLIFISQTGTAYAVPLPLKKDEVQKKFMADRMKKYLTDEEMADDSAVEDIQDEIRRKEIVSFALKFEGCRYVYGASGPNTFDCSGFTMYIMNHFSVELPHSASAQALLGSRVTSQSDLKAGDLIFFDTFGVKRITHVGMYIGDGKFIHAASSGVAVNSLSEGYYMKCYVIASRVL